MTMFYHTHGKLADALKIHLKVLCIREIHKVGKQNRELEP
jgi:hypothetical protein